MAFIDAHRDQRVEGRVLGVEPICRALQVAPSSYYAARGRRPSVRAVRDAVLTEQIRAVHAANYGVYGARKVHAQMRREGESGFELWTPLDLVWFPAAGRCHDSRSRILGPELHRTVPE